MKSIPARCRHLSHPLRDIAAAGLVTSLLFHEITAVHIVCSAVFVLAGTGHVLANGRWVRTVAKRVGRGLPRQVAVDAMLDGLMAVLSLTATVTGVALALRADDTAAYPVRDSLGETHVHAALLLLVVVIVHIVRHKRRRKASSSRPARSAGQPQPAPQVAQGARTGSTTASSR